MPASSASLISGYDWYSVKLGVQLKPLSSIICSTSCCVVEPVDTPMVWPSRSSIEVQPLADLTMMPTESVRYGVEKSQSSSRTGVMV